MQEKSRLEEFGSTRCDTNAHVRRACQASVPAAEKQTVTHSTGRQTSESSSLAFRETHSSVFRPDDTTRTLKRGCLSHALGPKLCSCCMLSRRAQCLALDGGSHFSSFSLTHNSTFFFFFPLLYMLFWWGYTFSASANFSCARSLLFFCVGVSLCVCLFLVETYDSGVCCRTRTVERERERE